MIQTGKQLNQRPLYLQKLIRSQDNGRIKVITGMRRTGKSCLMKLMVQHLLETGIRRDQIIEINFEQFRFREYTQQELLDMVRAQLLPDQKMYLFLDQIQHVDSWQEALSQILEEADCDIYVATANGKLLKSDSINRLSTGITVIKMFPLSFREYLDFCEFRVENLGKDGNRKSIIAWDGRRFRPEDLFELYLEFGGMPAISNVGMTPSRAMPIMEGIYSALVLRELIELPPGRGGKKIEDIGLLRDIINEMSMKIGENISLRSMGRRFIELYMDDDEYQSTPEMRDVQSYAGSILESYLFEHLKRYDILSDDYQKTNGKYYATDLGIRNLLIGMEQDDRNHMLENVVYLELLRCGYEVSNGFVKDRDIDFVTERDGERKFIQVTESLDTEELKDRCLTPLRMLPGNNDDKIVISLRRSAPETEDGIQIMDLLEFLMEDYDVLHEGSELH